MPKAFDFSNPPFDRLSGRELERFKACLDVAFFRQGQTVIRAGEVPNPSLSSSRARSRR